MDVFLSAPVVLMSGWGVPEDDWTSQWAMGNTVSCNIMGLFILLGGAGQLLYSGVLALYHLVTVRYNWPARKFARYVEPHLHVLSITVPIAWTTLIYATDYINSSHLDPGVCRASTNPPNCVHYDHLECNRGHEWKSAHLVLSVIYICFAIVVWTILVVSHILIWLTVRGTERRMMRYGHGSSRASSLYLTKKVGVQGMMYVGCFTSTNILSLIRVGILYQLFETSGVNRRLYFGFQIFALPLLQLQGFFHGIVFFSSRWKGLRQPGRAWERLSKRRQITLEKSGNEDHEDPTTREKDYLSPHGTSSVHENVIEGIP